LIPIEKFLGDNLHQAMRIHTLPLSDGREIAFQAPRGCYVVAPDGGTIPQGSLCHHNG
jgi:hypothetical protein